MMITMTTGVLKSIAFLVLLTGSSGAPLEKLATSIEGRDVAGETNGIQPESSTINNSNLNRIPRQRSFDQQFYSPHSLTERVQASSVLDLSNKVFGQKVKSSNSATPAKHSFYIVAPNNNLKGSNSQEETTNRNPHPKLLSSVSTGSSNEQSESSESSKLKNQSSEEKPNESLLTKRDSNKFQFPLSSVEDVHTDSGLLTAFGSSLISNDVFGSQGSGGSTSFGIPLPSSPPIETNTHTFNTFSGIPASSVSSHDIISLTKDLSPQDVTDFTNRLSPDEVTSLTMNLLKSLNIDTKDLDGLLNLNGPVLSSNSQASSGSSDQIKSFGIPLPRNNNLVSSDNLGKSLSVGIPLPDSHSVSSFDSFSTSIPRTNSHAIGIPLPNIESHASSGSVFHSSSSNFEGTQSTGISLPRVDSSSGNAGAGSNTVHQFPTSSNNFVTSEQIHSGSTNLISGTSNNILSQTQSFGIPLPETNQQTFQGSSANGQSTFTGSSGNIVTSEQVGIPLPSLNYESSQTVGIPFPENNSGTSLSVGIPLPNLNSGTSQSVTTSDSLSQTNSFTQGIPLPRTPQGSTSSFHSHSEASGQSHSVGIPLPRTPQGSTNSFASHSEASGQSHSVGIPLPRTPQGSTSSFDSHSEASGQSNSVGIPIPGLSSGTSSDSLTHVKSVGIPLPGINPDATGSDFFNPLTVVSEGTSQFSLNKDGNNNILSTSSSAKLSPVYVGTSDDDDEKVTVNVNVKSDPLDSLTIGQLLMSMNGQNGMVVLPMSSLNDVKKQANGLTVVTDSSAEADGEVVADISSSATTSAPATTTRRARRTTTTTKAPDTFRVKLSDLLYSKGQWLGTLLGGLIDYGRIAWDVVLDSQNQPVYGPTYGTYNTYGG